MVVVAKWIDNYAYLAKKANTNGNQSAYQKYLESQGDRDGYTDAKKLDWKNCTLLENFSIS